MMRFLTLLVLSFLFAYASDAPLTEEASATTGGEVPLVLVEPFSTIVSESEDAATGAERLMQEFPRVTDAGGGGMNVDVSQQFLAAARRLSDKFPADTAAAMPLYRAAEVALALGDPGQAAEIYQTVYGRYRAFSRAPESLFMLAFTYDENLNDLERARDRYEEFGRTYPDHPFADDAQMLIANLGKSDEEVLRELEARAKDQ